MPKEPKTLVPVWTLTTSPGTRVPALLHGDEALTPERLAQLRTALAAFVESPIVTLELHPLPETLDRRHGVALDAASPLAQHLAQLVSQTAKSSSSAARLEGGGEGLYRMVVPAKIAAQMGKGLVKPMTAKAGGILGPLVGSSGIVAHASFVPVEAAAIGAAGGAAGTAGVAAVTAGALTVAAPLVLMAVAAGVSAYADHKRQQATEHITELLQKLWHDNLKAERSELDGCRGAIDKAAAVLLDQGRIGASLGLDSAVHAIDKAIADAESRLAGWRKALEDLPDGPVELSALTKAFPGIAADGGEFRTHLELATLATALKCRVIVLQAVEHSQADNTNPFENLVRSLKSDQARLDELESGIASVLLRLSSLELRPPSRILDKLMTRREVDDLLRSSYRLHALGDGVEAARRETDVVIDIARNSDGSILVLPAVAAA